MNKTKEAICNAAIEVFSEYGFEAAKMDNIASAAKVSKGTLYYHFKSKEELFGYIVKNGMESMKEEVSYKVNKEKNSILKLKVLCRAQIELLYKENDFFKVILSHLWGQQIRNLELRKLMKTYINYIANIFKEASDEGYIKNGDTNFMAYSFFGMMCSAAAYQLIDGDEKDLNSIVDKLMNNLLNGIE